MQDCTPDNQDWDTHARYEQAIYDFVEALEVRMDANFEKIRVLQNEVQELKKDQQLIRGELVYVQSFLNTSEKEY